VEQALGDGIKVPMPSEMKNRDVVRRSLVALGPIGAGERFTEDNLGARRPGAGVSPMEYWEWLDGRADDDIPAGAPVTR
jgi:N-acetylneuraminate synthase